MALMSLKFSRERRSCQESTKHFRIFKTSNDSNMGQKEIVVLFLSVFIVSTQALCAAEQALLRELVVEEPACPDEEDGLALWSDTSVWGGSLPSKRDVVTIDAAIKLDVPEVNVKLINIIGNGKLVFSDTMDIDIETEGIMVQDSASLIIGSHACRFQHDVHILFKGIRTADRSRLGDKGEKYIVVQDNGFLQLHGKKVLAWTKLDGTANRWESYASNSNKVIYMHKNSAYDGVNPGYQGLAMYIFKPDFTPKQYKAYDFEKAAGKESKEQQAVNSVIKDLDSVEDNDIVAIAIQQCFKTTATLTDLDDKLQEIIGVTNPDLRIANLKRCDAYSLVFQKGGANDLKVDRKIGKNIQHALASIVVNDRKISAVSHVEDTLTGRSKVDFRILSLDVGFPTINVIDDLSLSSWKVGDELLLTSTDYSMYHAEVRTIKEVIGTHSIRLSAELEYRHFGKIEDNVDMRGEVAHLNRNIKFEAEVQDYCPPSNENCGEEEGFYNFDTYGAHIKILHGFGGVAIQAVELMRFGQLMDKGHYPIHFHVCGLVGEKEAVVRNNVVRHSFARATTIHGTYGTSMDSPGVVLEDNVAYDIFGNAFFVEDGAERGTIFKRNLGAVVKVANNGFTEDLKRPAVFWWTTPEVALIDNVAAGSDGMGFWLTIPLDVVGPSYDLGVYANNEARHTPIWTIDNNVAHSNYRGGFNFENTLLDENGTTEQGLNYEALSNPLNETSPGVKVQVVRLTAYKNVFHNCWIEAGPLEVYQLSSAESRIGVQIVRSGIYGQFLRKSIVIGRSKENYEDADYPDTPDIKRYVGWVIWSGPTLVKEVWFDGFGNDPNGRFVSGAIGFVPKTDYTSSSLCNATELRFGFKDKVVGGEGNRVFVGTLDDAQYGYDENLDGDESKSFIDGDGTVSKCPHKKNFKRPVTIVKPEKFAVVDSCEKRENWKMFVCNDRFGKIRVNINEDFKGASKNAFEDSTQAMRRNRKDASDIAYEDHTGKKGIDYITVLESDKYYYAVQWFTDFPKKTKLRGLGVQKGYGVVAGLCLPENIGYSDLNLHANLAGLSSVSNEQFIHATSIDEVFNDNTMSTVFLDGRILYVRFVSERIPETEWKSLSFDDCPEDKCPYFMVDVLVDDVVGYTHCFNPTPEELATDNELGNPNFDSMSCTLPAGLPPESDWGAGDYYKTAVDGGWSDWLDWTPCCPATNQTRARYCDDPPPYGAGAGCVGDATEIRACTEPCA